MSMHSLRPPPCTLPGCSRPCYVADRVVHDFCGRTHAKQALRQGVIPKLDPPHGSCQQCALQGCSETVYFDASTSRVHDFCSWRHSRLAMERGEWPQGDTSGSSECELPGCSDLCYKDPLTHEEMRFCGRSHSNLFLVRPPCARRSCSRSAWVDANVTRETQHLMHCGRQCADQDRTLRSIGYSATSSAATSSAATGGPSDTQCSLPGCARLSYFHGVTGACTGFCCADHRDRATQRGYLPVFHPHIERIISGGQGAAGFQLRVLKRTHPEYGEIKHQFISKWGKPGPLPALERVFEITMPAWVVLAYDEYCQQLQVSGIEANVRRRFHGTSASSDCRVYAGLAGAPCADHTQCAACGIMTSGFDSSFAGKTAARTNFQLRYGRGIYFSSVSGKSNDYSEQSEKVHGDKRYRMMFICSVAAGHAFVTTETALDDSQCPPNGYHSVVGDVSDHGLNYDEIVVYDNRAVLPRYLISYSFRA
eukprot:TRINITY_DN4583_c0_g1_i1.p1 TRINITY_DN4583_c0_g1~~TRINITY_DN4583_c0_g1_i1.p1  ORF type:complete len:479 (-),score=112.80 TRINITY_DN4583_c0_g1_i1:118-1554(-)